MTQEMDLERLFKLILSDPDDIHIEYSNVNGKERLIVNGEELTKDEPDFDDAGIIEKAERFKNNMKELDDSDFGQVTQEISECVELGTFNELLNQEHYTAEEADVLEAMLSFANTVVYEYLTDKISDMQEIIANL